MSSKKDQGQYKMKILNIKYIWKTKDSPYGLKPEEFMVSFSLEDNHLLNEYYSFIDHKHINSYLNATRVESFKEFHDGITNHFKK